MVPRVGMLSIAARTGAVLTVITALAGCGSSAPSNATARRGFATEASAPARPGSCARSRAAMTTLAENYVGLPWD